MADMIKLGGMWKNKTKDGKTYLSGYLGDAKLLVFPNSFKLPDNEADAKKPDYILYVAAKEKKEAPVADEPVPYTDQF